MIPRLFSRVPRGLVLGLVPGLLVIGASGAQPAYADVSPSVVDIVNQNGLCLTAVNGAVVIDQCNGGLAQDWRLVTVPNHPGDFLIRSDLTGDCLAPTNSTVGAQVVQRVCDFSGTDLFELWFTEPGLSAGFVQIANGRDGLVMVPAGCSNRPGTPVVMGERSRCIEDDWRSVAS